MNTPATKRSPLHPYAGRFEVHATMPEQPVSRDQILDELKQMSTEEDRKGDSGRVSGSIYSGDHDHYHFQVEAFGYYGHANVLQRDMYPSATKMEAEIIAMTADILHGDEDTGGLVTSGGTESLVTAMLAYREWGRNRGIARPQIIMPVTAHPGHSKAFHWFDIDAVIAPVDESQKVDLDFVRANINEHTVALVGSAGTYPHGVIDPIPELGQIALENGLGLHVDGCLGGWILAWARDLGYDHTPFDLSVPGVTSISADTHKYGYALKGSSVLLFRPKSLRRGQYILIDGWPGGAYASPGMGGSRSGGLISATWASLLSFGKSGYREIAKDIFRTADEIRAAVVSHPELKLVGDSLWNIAFTSDQLDIFHVNDGLADLGWRMNGLQFPPALHFCITRPNTKPGVTEDFVRDLTKAVSYAKNPANPMPRSGAMYGAGGAQRLPVDEMREASANRLDAIHEVGPLS